MMKYIYIEAKDDHQPEFNFLKVYIEHLSLPDMELVPVNGKDNLLKQKIQLKQNMLEGNRSAILFDADELVNNGGFSLRLSHIQSQLQQMQVAVPVFLWPNNHDDGDFEMMLEQIVRKDIHKLFFDCFCDYESCVASNYNTPNRKGKFHTFVTAQKDLSKSKRDKIGRGNWLFDDSNMWNLDAPYLLPLKTFLLGL